MVSLSLLWANTIDAPHTHVFLAETVTSNCAATQWCVCGAIIGTLLFSECIKTAPHTRDLGCSTRMHWGAAQCEVTRVRRNCVQKVS
jgi:hypothetical protein